MAIARDTSATYAGNTGSASYTVTGSNTLLLVGFYGTSANTISNVQWNGSAMTQLAAQTLPSTNRAYVYRILGAATGTHNITFTPSSGNFDVTAVSYTGVLQSGFPDASGSNAAGSYSGTLTTTATTVANNDWATLFFITADGGGASAGTGSTLVTSLNNDNFIFDSNAALTPAGSKSMSIALTGTQRSTSYMVAFAPSVSAVNSGFINFM